MTVRDKKVAVLKALKTSNEPLSLPQLLEILGDGYAERSVRRWLGLLVYEGSVEKTGEKKGTRYRALPSKNIDVTTPSTRPFSQNNLNVVNRVRRPIFEREPVAYKDHWLENYLPNKTSFFSENDLENLASVGMRSEHEEPAGTYARHIYHRLLIDLSYNSSRLEGNTYSLLETERLLFEGSSAEGKIDEEKVMILNHKEAIRFIIDNASKIKTDENAILTLHYLLSDGLVIPENSGKVRNTGVRIGGSTYIPYEQSKKLSQQLEKICTKCQAILNPFEQSLFLLVHVSYLQAFIDVNKRTARLAANVPLIKHNLVPLSFNDVSREDYTSSMIAIYEHNDVGPITDLFKESYFRTAKLYDVSVEALGFDEVRVRYRNERRKIIRHIIENELTGLQMNKLITTETAQLIPKEFHQQFLEDIREDLKEISPQRIAGMGITEQQLQAWQQKIL